MQRKEQRDGVPERIPEEPSSRTFKRIIATETADLSALTEPEIEAIAKKHLGAPPAVPLRTDWGGLRKEHV